jgi:hypothetical protein
MLKESLTIGALALPESIGTTHVIREAPVRMGSPRARPFTRGVPATMLLTADQLFVIAAPEDGSRLLMRQGRNDLAMARRPAARGGELVWLSALDGQEATLRFDRQHAAAAEALSRWHAGV